MTTNALRILLTSCLVFISPDGYAQTRTHAAAAPALIEPYTETHDIGAEVIGILREVRVEQNDLVERGAVIAVVENAAQKAAVEAAGAQLAMSEAQLKLAELAYSRREPLRAKGAASQAELDQARAERDVAAAKVRLDRSQLELAKANLEKTEIKSPLKGTVLQRYVRPGEAVSNQPPTRIAAVGETSRLRARAEVDELDVGALHLGQRVMIKADALHNKTLGGTVVRMAPIMGAKRIQTGRPQEKTDSKVMEVLIDLDGGIALPVGLRVDAFFETPSTNVDHGGLKSGKVKGGQ